MVKKNSTKKKIDIKKIEDITLHDIFLISITIKGIVGLLQFIFGMIIILNESDFLMNLIQDIFAHEIGEESHGVIANYLIHSSQSFSPNTILFIALYLIIQGVIKMSLVIGLWLKKEWAYPAAGIVLSLFVVYEMFRIFKNHSKLLILFTILDIMIIVLLKHEHDRITKNKTHGRTM